MINIPDKYREEFDRSADFAVASEKFTVKELAQHLGVGELVASIMIGYMEKTGLVTKGRFDEVRRARIDMAEWERIEKKIENYIPLPEVEEVKEIKDEQVTLPEIERQSFIKKEIYVTDSALMLSDKEETAINYEDIREIFVFEPTLFKKGAIVFSCDNIAPRYKDLKSKRGLFFFKKKEKERALKLAEELASWLGVKITLVAC